jgi:ribose 5-phosphate isomerase B
VSVKIAIAADHAGYLYKDRLVAELRAHGHTVLDLGTDGPAAVDYPDYGFAAGQAVASGLAERGIVICGSSIGIAVAANKVPGIRCAVASEPLATELARRHNDANVLALAERLTGWEMIERLVSVFLETPFEGGRHQHRVAKLAYGPAEQAKAAADVARGHVSGAETPKATA